ncbi:hypothetical protein GGR50DRAFT_655535 [Xylaria sp. CBS 124048]|nr:hypothetical protein GGR50DRAFT_655535 [Xylaria sp. CBS 124048]
MMKHRLVVRAGRGSKRFGIQVRQIQSQATFQQRLGITAPPGTSQREVLDQLSKHVLERPRKSYHEAPGTNGMAVLASKDFANWLEDESFMSEFVQTLSKPTTAFRASHQRLNVLSGITDGLSLDGLSKEPRSGFSVLRGPTDRILPGLWEKEGFGTSQDDAACVSFVTNPLSRDAGALEVTLPLANTVFQNGRRSTLHASRWDISSKGSAILRTREPKMIQRISAQGDSANRTLSVIPLLPLTPPRKIIAGLGNIVRQVEVDGVATPASKELEKILPGIFEERAKRDPVSSPSSIGVWCWVIPPHIMKSQDFSDLKLLTPGCSQTEADITLGSMKLFTDLLSSGCRLHKILSGGGGWGPKQGLLSLDPETAFSLPGNDDDMEMFVKSFWQRNSTEATGGLVSPGYFLLFCAEPQVTNMEPLASQLVAPMNTFTFGITPDPDLISPSPIPRSAAVKISDQHFGVSSATGLFLRTIPGLAGINGDAEPKDAAQSPFTTKINVPGAYLYV